MMFEPLSPETIIVHREIHVGHYEYAMCNIDYCVSNILDIVILQCVMCSKTFLLKVIV